MDKGAAKAEGGTPAPRGVESQINPLPCALPLRPQVWLKTTKREFLCIFCVAFHIFVAGNRN